MLVNRCGKKWVLRRATLWLDYPYGPPPKHFHKGYVLISPWSLGGWHVLTPRSIEFSDEGVSIKEREMDPRFAQNLDRFMVPLPMAMAVFSFGSTLLKQNYRDLRTYLGFESTPDKSQSQQSSTQKPVNELQATKDAAAANNRSTMAKRTAPDAASRSSPATGAATATSSDAAQSSPKQNQPVETNTSSGGQPSSKTEPKIDGILEDGVWSPMRQHIDGAWNNMKRTLAAKSRRPPTPHTSGCIMVSGMVELTTEKAFVVIDVAGYWDPKVGNYDHSSTRMILRRLRPNEQRPLRPG